MAFGTAGVPRFAADGYCTRSARVQVTAGMPDLGVGGQPFWYYAYYALRPTTTRISRDKMRFFAMACNRVGVGVNYNCVVVSGGFTLGFGFFS
jgi:hypothetical protein